MKKVNYLKGIAVGLSVFALLGAKEMNDTSFAFKNIYTDSSTGRIVYLSDISSNRVPDFSYAGYQNSNVALPTVTSPVLSVSCGNPSDCTSDIQAAINTVATYTLSGGFRGVVSLPAGTYNITNGLSIPESGIVLQGTGSGTNPSVDTIISVNGNSGATPYVITSGGLTATAGWPIGTASSANIDNAFIPVGATEFRVTMGGYVPAVGDTIIFVYPTTTAWAAAVNYGGIPYPGTTGDPIWDSTLPEITYKRTVTQVATNSTTYSVSVDAPIFNNVVKSLSQAYIYPFDGASAGYKNNIGIENLRITINSPDGITPYIQSGINFSQAQDVWVNNVILTGYQLNGFDAGSVDRITINNSKALAPLAPWAGENRYAFRSRNFVSGFLCDGCVADLARHAFIVNLVGSSGNVFVNSTSTNGCNPSEGHQKWSTGNLFDLVTAYNNTSLDASCENTSAGFYDRGTEGTSHGWSAAHSVMWGVQGGSTDRIIVQQPPTAQNYCYNCSAGTVTGVGDWANLYQGSPGYIENNASSLSSLFYMQLAERLSAADNGPSAPAGLVTSVSGNNVTLTWDNLAMGAQDNVIERSTDGGLTYSQLAVVSASATTYVDNAGSSAPNYVYRVYARKNMSGTVVRGATSNISPIVGRYVKITLKAPSASSTTVRINEMKVFNAAGTNVSQGKTVVATAGTTNPSRLVDGVLTNYWGSTLPVPGTSWADAVYAYVDLGAVNRVKQVVVYQGTTLYPSEYYVYVSTDAQTWTQVWGKVSGTGGTVTINL